MSTGTRFSCFIVGEGTLPIQCGEVLLSRGHGICGIISPEESVNDWAAKKNIPHTNANDDLTAFLRRRPFDYLFSVVNVTYYHRLLKECIEVPRKCAINYHDALLPRYAGFYPTSWALMNREKIHGVTWHQMTEFIDAGNILKQQPVPVADNDTAFTLNAKCYDAAICSFGELLDDLTSNSKLGRQQDLKKRTYFPIYRRPVAACLLRWDRSAHDIDAFVRALNFTPYPNPLGLPKLAVGEKFFLVPRIEVLSSRSGMEPGTVVGIDEKCLKVATADQDVAIRVVLNPDGEPIAISDLASQLLLGAGDSLGSVDERRARQITVCYARTRRHEGFWLARLSQLRPVRIPQRGRSPLKSKTAHRAKLRIGLPNEVIRFLENRRASWKTEEFLVAAFAAYLSRIVRGGNFDIGFSDLNLQRKFAGLNELFAFHVPLRVNADDTQTFAECFDALQREFDLVGRHGTYARDVIARYPVLRSALTLTRGVVLPLVVEQTENLEHYEPNDGIEFTLVTAKNATECLWAYDAEIFDENIVMSMASQFATFLKSIAADSDRMAIADLPLLTEEERRQILVEFNNTLTEYPKDICFHQLFEAQVERTPGAIALVASDMELSYRELNARANQLAHHLVELGVGPEIRVGIFMERSAEMVVAALGILKTGGAYVPLHPDYPRERVALMLADIEATILLTQQRLLPKLPRLDAKLICLDTDWKELARKKRQNFPSRASADNLAYVTYTSGSTGKPNPVMVEHRSLVNYLCWVNTTLVNDHTQSLPMVSRLNFDGCLKQVFAPLLRGSQVRILSDDLVLQPAALLKALSQGVKAGLNCVPSLWSAILDAVDSKHAAIPVENFTSLFLGGERFSDDLLRRSVALAPHLDIWNLYGPTETTANASAARIHAGDEPTIGSPIANAQIYILNPSMKPVPIGLPGEIYIGGVGLSRGYHNRPDLTAEKFIPNPFSAEPGRRLYKSGDLACYRPDGNILFLGRTDDQVKIRGFRVELGEIEATLNNIPAVQEAVVTAREDPAGNQRLVGYIVNRQPIQVVDLRKCLKEWLPDYMVPADFLFLDSLPLTPNGKLDRNALPVPDQSRPELEERFVAPRTPVEEMIAEIWAQVLKLDTIGIHDNFFALGGHSLLATQVISRASHQLQVDLPLRVLFEHPTVAELVRRIEEVRSEASRLPAQPLVSVPRDKALPLSFPQQRLWFLDQYEPNRWVYNISSAFRLKGSLNIGVLEQSLNEIVKRHESLRTTFAVLEGQPVQVIAPSPDHALSFVDLREIPNGEREEQAQRICEDEARRPFDLARGPLLRARVIQLGEDDHILLLTMHHIVSDGWSMGVLGRELSVLYRAFLKGEHSPLPELCFQYADFAMWQRQWLKEKLLDRQLAYWKKQLANNVTLDLPTDRPRPVLQSHRGARHSLTLSNELTERLKALSRKQGTTLFMTLLAAFQVLLHRVTGQEDIAVGSPIAGRNRFELENLIGFFLNTLVLRTNLSGKPTFNELLARVRTTCLEAYAHQEVPFEKLLEKLQPERDLSQFPFFQVFFNMLNFRESGTFELSGLTTEPIQLSAITAKFDLTLYTWESHGALSCSLVYNPDLFEAATIVRLLGCYHTLLHAIADNPQRPIWSLPLLTERERAQCSVRRTSVAPANFFVEFQETDIEQSISARFEKIVNLYGDRIAVKTTNDQWTYRELNAKANEIAQAILSSVANERGRMGLLFEHDAQMIAAILGVLKAGQTYVPLDPAYPPERLSYILEDSGTAAIATNGKNVALAKRLTTGSLHLINVDEFECPTLADNFSLPISPDILSYILYTSGSTGRPKGVMQNHRNVLHHIRNYTNSLHISSDDRLTLLSSYGFDAAVMDIFGALLNGAALHVMDLREEGPSALLDRLVKENITIYHSTPTVYRYLMSTVTGREDLSRVRLVVLGGEEVHKDDVDRFKEIFSPSAIFINGFGPTESTLALQYFINHNRETAGNVVPVGYPVEDTEILLLNEAGQDAELFGEIAIRSEQVALGYWQKPEVTETAFLTDCENASKRLYRTGDLGRLLPDGSIAFVGRKDDQVKIRGYRIEPGEISSVLSAHPGVRENIIVARQDVPGNERLVAYLVARTEPAPTPSELRSFVKLKLPEYMVPSTFVFLHSLPLTPNGKVDRNALPAPDQSRPELAPTYTAPRTLLEEVLVEIWADVLKLNKVGIHDNFFNLGGHSLLAAQVVSRIASTCRTDMPLRSLFECPTIADLAERIDCIRGHVERLRAGSLSASSPLQKIPLSFAQQRLWFFDQFQPNSSVYNVPTVLRLRGKLYVRALERSLNEIVRRHDSLRTNFPTIDGGPVQSIGPAFEMLLPLEDLTGIPAGEREDEAQRLVREQHAQPFDLSRGPLLRVLLIRCGQDDHILALTMHHIASDGWSIGVLFRELSLLYEAYTQGRVSPLSDLAIQYADFAIWQRQWLRGEVLAEQLSYWKKQLAEAPALLNLPTDRPRPVVQSYRGAIQLIELSEELTAGLKGLSRKHGATLFMTLLAAFQTLLYRYTGQEEILVGSPIANRNREETEDLIGFFANTLVLRTDLSGDPTFKEVLRRVREVALEAYNHQDLPFEKLVEEIKPERNLSHSPVFQVMLVLQNTPGRAPTLSGLEVTAAPLGGETAKFDLTLSLEPAGGKLRGYLQYSTDLFDEATIERMVRHYRVLLDSIISDPNRHISNLCLLTAAENHQLLVEWNDTKTEYPKDKCVHELFEEQVERTPESVAVVFEDEQLTYRELNSRANQLAHYLRKQGVGPEVLVGICLERSTDMIVAVLAILKADGAYVPIDPSYPKDRLEFTIEDAQISVLVTQRSVVEKLTANKAKIFCFDRNWEEISRESRDNLPATATPENLAYVIYTSGSTGKPKGVSVEHRALANYCSDVVRQLKPGAIDSFAMVQPLTVDACLTMLFPSLLAGSALHVISRDRALNAADLGDYLQQWSIDFFKISPSHLAALQQTATSSQRLIPERCLILGGENLRWDLVRSVQALAPQCRIYNHYGPTETTVGVLMCPAHEGGSSQEHQLSTPIGRPIANTQTYILDHQLAPVPVGVIGELYIGGNNLARSYINQAQLTAESFVPNPFGETPGARLYRTGDRARYLLDGNIEFLGRNDDQIKIRGFRVEPAEIEAALLELPQVGQVVVTLAGSPENERLIVYMVSVVDQRPSRSELRSFLKTKLPDYMVPADFVWLEMLPRTAHGKLDRRALPPLDRSEHDSDSSYVAPRTSTEQLLAEIWSEVLKVDKVSIQDNFFDLGGHSLLAIPLVSRLSERFKINMPLRNLFEYPSIEGLSKLIESIRKDTTSIRTLPIKAEEIKGEYPLSFAQERFWFLQQLQHNNPAYKSTHGFNIRGHLNIDALSQGLSEIVRRHEVLRTTFHFNRDRPVQRVSSAEAFKLSVVNLSHKHDIALNHEVQEILKAQFRLPFDLSNDVLLRATLIKLNDDEHKLLLVVHHIVWDHWSIEIFFDELSALYRGFCSAKPSALPLLPIQYKDYALWQRKALQGREMSRHLAYWKKQLEGSPPSLQLPADRRRPLKQTFAGERQEVVLPGPLVHALKFLSQREGTTPFMTLLAAFKILLWRLAGQDDIVVGAPVAGRDRIETEKLIGCFLNSLVLRTNLSGSPTFRQLLGRVREVVLGAFDHQELPFEKLLEEISVARDLSRTPLFQVFVNSYSLEAEPPRLHDLDLQPMLIAKPAANFDLTLYIRERDRSTVLILVYNTDIFADDRVAEMLDQYHGLLSQIVDNPDQTIDSYSLVTSAARRLLPNPSETLYADWVGSVPDRLSHQAARLPEKLAVVDAGDRWTYRQLNSRSNQLAHYLVGKGIQPEDVVAIYGHRSASLVWAVLGVLKAGAAFLILDPAYPAQRLIEYNREAQPRGFVQIEAAGVLPSELEKYLEPRLSLRVLLPRLSDLSPKHPLMAYSTADLNLKIRPEHLAYISFTSGSTGLPKGVAGRHGPLSNFLPWQSNRFGLSSSDRFSLLSGLSHDPLQREIFTTLWVGGTICIPGAEVIESPGELFNWMLQQEITFVHLTPPMGRILTETCHEDSKSLSLRYAFFVGDKLTSADVESVQRIAPWVTCVNYYGSTETQRAVSYYEIPPGSNVLNNREIVPVGRGMPNVQLLVLNNAQELAGIGEVGEIYMRSPHLARGYLNDMSLTRARFLANPITHDRADLCYRTGDLGRYLPDGNVEILGRIDRQIKMRGFRVEVGEIESVLKQHSDIKDAMVLPRSHGSGNQYLAAYLTAQAGKIPKIAELQALLKSKLPTYMIPSVTKIIEKFPLTPNGKIDTKALPLLDEANIQPQATSVPPRTPIEKAVLEIWAKVLAVDQLGIDDNFFEMGGHSLAAMLVLSRISNALHVKLPLGSLFERPTVAGLAACIEETQQGAVAKEEMTELLAELESLSDDEAQMLVDRQRWMDRKG